MPNWCYNRVKVYGDEDTVEQVKEIHDIFENHTDPFNQIFPIPDFKNIPNEKGELPKLEQRLNPDGSVFYETYNFPDGKNDDRWYHWCSENWGTKWDVSELNIEYLDDEQLELTFSTAWSPPEGVVDMLRKSIQSYHSNVSMMNQDVRLQDTIRTVCKVSTWGCIRDPIPL